MKIAIKVPQLPESVSEATLLTWHKNLGESIAREENLCDLETDKVVLELPAPDHGIITELVVPAGTTVFSGQLIAYMESRIAVIDSTSEQSIINNPKESSAVVMPAAQKIAADQAIDLSQIIGTGRANRILKEDLLLQSKNPAIAIPAAITVNNTRIEERVAMTRVRKKIAERLLSSQQNSAILTTFNEVNMQAIINLRNQYKDQFMQKHQTKLGFMAFFVQAAVYALKHYPILNASIDGEDIVYHAYFDIGIAVSSARGLVVPILRNTEQMSIADIETKIADFGARAKIAKLEIEELQGGTFSITNGGTFGSMMSTPIINPPQSAILGMHAIKERAVVENSQIVIRPMMYLALSYDHRIIDGREAVSALVSIKDILEDPRRLLLNV